MLSSSAVITDTSTTDESPIIFKSAAVIIPLTLIFPITSKAFLGLLVPMPTVPVSVITSRSC